MRPNRLQIIGMKSAWRAGQRGVSIVAAIFLLLLLGGLTALMMTLTSGQHAMTAQHIRGVTAYQAARAGIEWGVYQRVILNSCNNANPARTFGGILSEFDVTVTCSDAGAASYTEGADTILVKTITSTAVSKGLSVGHVNYVERELQVTIE
jgi:MSHA biogenesis protein MshP